MDKYKVCDEEGIECENYVGCWYNNQYDPQRVYVWIGNEGTFQIDYDCETGSSVTADVFSGRALMLKLPHFVYSESECEEIIAEIADDVADLVDSYEEEWDGSNYCGKWDRNQVDDLQSKLDGCYSVFGWDIDGIIESGI